jgi:hypothetical protein
MTTLTFVLTIPMYILGCMVVFIIWVVAYISVNSTNLRPANASRPEDQFDSLGASSKPNLSEAELERIARANEAQLNDATYHNQEQFEYSYNGSGRNQDVDEKKNMIPQ